MCSVFVHPVYFFTVTAVQSRFSREIPCRLMQKVLLLNQIPFQSSHQQNQQHNGTKPKISKQYEVRHCSRWQSKQRSVSNMLIIKITIKFSSLLSSNLRNWNKYVNVTHRLLVHSSKHISRIHVCVCVLTQLQQTSSSRAIAEKRSTWIKDRRSEIEQGLGKLITGCNGIIGQYSIGVFLVVEPRHITRPKMQQPRHITRPRIQQPRYTTRPKIQQPQHITQNKTQQPWHTTRPKIQQPRHTTRPRIQQPRHITWPKMQQPRHITWPKIQQPRHTTQPKIQQPWHITWPQIQQPRHITRPKIQQPRHITRPKIQ